MMNKKSTIALLALVVVLQGVSSLSTDLGNEHKGLKSWAMNKAKGKFTSMESKAEKLETDIKQCKTMIGQVSSMLSGGGFFLTQLSSKFSLYKPDMKHDFSFGSLDPTKAIKEEVKASETLLAKGVKVIGEILETSKSVKHSIFG